MECITIDSDEDSGDGDYNNYDSENYEFTDNDEGGVKGESDEVFCLDLDDGMISDGLPSDSADGDLLEIKEEDEKDAEMMDSASTNISTAFRLQDGNLLDVKEESADEPDIKEESADEAERANQTSITVDSVPDDTILKEEEVGIVLTYDDGVLHDVAIQLSEKRSSNLKQQAKGSKPALEVGKNCQTAMGQSVGNGENSTDPKFRAQVEPEGPESGHDVTPSSSTSQECAECTRCAFKSQSKTLLYRHLKKTHGVKLPYACDVCDFRSKYSHSLLRHKRLHADGKPFRCDECDHSTLKAVSLAAHKRFAHSDQKPYTCDLCPFRTAYSVSLKRHKQSHEHKKKMNVGFEGPLKTLVCHYCQWTTDMRNVLVAHIKNNHQPSLKRRNRTGIAVEKKRNVGVEGTLKTLVCHYCQWTTDIRKVLVAHIKNNHQPWSSVQYCKWCCFKADTKYEVDCHMERIHSEQNIAVTNGKKLVCYYCKWTTYTHSELVVHITNRHHPTLETLRCTQCSFKTNSKWTLRDHKQKKHPRPRPFACDQCGLRTHCRTSLKKHKNTHLEAKYECDMCDYKGKTEEYLISHKRIHTGEKPYMCTVCDWRFARFSDLWQHKRTHTGQRPYKCDLCDYKATRSTFLKFHRRTHFGEKPYKCGQCDYSATTSSALSLHRRLHTGNLYACDECDYKSPARYSVTYHKRIHQRGNDRTRTIQRLGLRCEICGQKVDSQMSLPAHMLTHQMTHTVDGATIGEPYSCDLCDFRSATILDMSNHKRTHKIGKPHPCALCSVRTASPSRLLIHYRTHTGERPFACDQCDFSTHSKQNLTLHLKLHADIRPYTCDICGYRAARPSRLLAHKRTHGEKVLACDFCDYRCVDSDMLKIHLRRHTGERPFVCDWCDHSTTSSANMLNHKRREHPNNLYACGECSFQDFSRHKVEQHLKLNHPTLVGGRPASKTAKSTIVLLFKCPQCSFSGRDRSQVEEHLLDSHPDVSIAEATILQSAVWESD